MSSPNYAKSSEFQSTPVITDERTHRRPTYFCPLLLFQSTPVITDERTFARCCALSQASSFNPRPSSLTSEPARDYSVLFISQVSIHARHH